MLKKTLLIAPIFLVASLFAASLKAQTIARLTVKAGDYVRSNVPVSVNLDEITFAADSTLALFEIKNGKRIAVPFQIENDTHRYLWWILEGQTPSGKKRTYEISMAEVSDTGDKITVSFENEGLTVKSGNKPVLQYRYQTVYPPVGVDTVYKRSGFIHPLWSPSGKVLTRIQPRDHWHHYGIWNPWTHVAFRGDTIDFWNLVKKEGTVRFSGFGGKESGPVYGGFEALHEHVAFKDNTKTVALNETWKVKVYNGSDDFWLWDFTSTLNCATESPVTLLKYRYGGVGFRATEDWTNQNSYALTSEGKKRKEADASRARWCIVGGETDGQQTGVLFMSYPTNYNHPEPMRVWPTDANGGRGDMFFSFSPTRNTNWRLEPGKSYTLRYRMLVFDGKISPEKAEQAWQAFAYPPVVVVEKVE